MHKVTHDLAVLTTAIHRSLSRQHVRVSTVQGSWQRWTSGFSVAALTQLRISATQMPSCRKHTERRCRTENIFMLLQLLWLIFNHFLTPVLKTCFNVIILSTTSSPTRPLPFYTCNWKLEDISYFSTCGIFFHASPVLHSRRSALKCILQ